MFKINIISLSNFHWIPQWTCVDQSFLWWKGNNSIFKIDIELWIFFFFLSCVSLGKVCFFKKLFISSQLSLIFLCAYPLNGLQYLFMTFYYNIWIIFSISKIRLILLFLSILPDWYNPWWCFSCFDGLCDLYKVLHHAVIHLLGNRL